MVKLVCNIDECKTKTTTISGLVDKYNSILQSINTLENSRGSLWKSDSEKVYSEKYLERKKDLENLALVYSELVTFLNKAFSSYENVESKYR